MHINTGWNSREVTGTRIVCIEPFSLKAIHARGMKNMINQSGTNLLRAIEKAGYKKCNVGSVGHDILKPKEPGVLFNLELTAICNSIYEREWKILPWLSNLEVILQAFLVQFAAEADKLRKKGK